jgi:hypothetical protein
MAVVFPVLGQDTAPLKKRLTNKDVIEMVQMGLSEDVIIAKIRTATATDTNSVSLDTSVDGLKALKEANVPDSVIKVMINPGPPPAAIVAGASPMSIDPNLPLLRKRESGALSRARNGNSGGQRTLPWGLALTNSWIYSRPRRARSVSLTARWFMEATAAAVSQGRSDTYRADASCEIRQGIEDVKRPRLRAPKFLAFFDQHSITFNANPPNEVSLYRDCISIPV